MSYSKVRKWIDNGTKVEEVTVEVNRNGTYAGHNATA
jgi:hypothetical protein